jgi:hypothetical protein
MAELTKIKVAVLCRRCGRARLITWKCRAQAERHQCIRCAGVAARRYSFKVCAWCKAEFTAQRNNPKHHWCSQACNSKSRGYEGRQNRTVRCVGCGIEFIRARNVRPPCFCSRACASKAQRKRILLACLRCGRDFYTVPAKLVLGRRYCSQRCAYDHRSDLKGFLLGQLAAFERKFAARRDI